MHRRPVPTAFLALILLAAVAVGCSDDGEGAAGGEPVVAVDDAAPLDGEVSAGVGNVLVRGAEPGTELRLVDDGGRPAPAFFAPDGAEGDAGVVDDEGNLGFGRVPAGSYRVVGGEGAELVASDPVDVLAIDDHPDRSFFDDQELVEGINYIEMRDGTTLAAMVRFPSIPRDDVPADGPYPTVVEMSGYDPANPESPEGTMQLADALGYATVGINLRGTGCSGGSLSFFENDQVADGYDAIEAVAAQDWVANHEVGMIGLSYPGITQLFMASTAPPSLAAAAPQSVIDEVYAGILYPGGIYNSGFAREWSESVASDAAAEAEPYVAEQIEAGDEDCEANQEVRSQNLDLVAGGQAEPFYRAERYDPISPVNRVGDIEVPLFITGQWQDEQTGGHFANMLDDFAGTDRLHVTLTNGSHADGLNPPSVQRWAEFLDLYVGRRIPEIPVAVRALAPATLEGIFGEGDDFGPDRFTDAGSYEEALTAYEAEDPIRIVFENGAGTPNPGGPGGTFEAEFAEWPLPEAEPTTFWFGTDGELADAEPEARDGEDGTVVEYVHDPEQGQERTLDEEGVEAAFGPQPPWSWPSPQQGEAATWLTPPLEDDLVVAGPARADLWLRSSAADTDLEVTITEVDLEGNETYVQTGWLRASHRALDEEASTDLRPVALHTEEAAEPLPEDEWVQASVEVFPFAHVFRAGSRLRVYVDSPGANRARWAFDTIEGAGESNLVALSAEHPSALTVGVVDGLDVPRARPSCGALRAQPCRPYEPIENVPGG